jgi:hypothetical protein
MDQLCFAIDMDQHEKHRSIANSVGVFGEGATGWFHFTYRCPRTGRQVQGWTAAETDDDLYDPRRVLLAGEFISSTASPGRRWRPQNSDNGELADTARIAPLM